MLSSRANATPASETASCPRPGSPKSNAQVIESTTLSPRLAQLTRNFQIGFVGFYCLRMLSSSEISIAEVAEQRTLSSSVFRAAEHGKALLIEGRRLVEISKNLLSTAQIVERITFILPIFRST